MSNHANEAVIEQLAETVLAMTVEDFLTTLRLRKLDKHEQAQAAVNELITEMFFERSH
jgi:uncharacterized membrane protein YheB (UPF0754 family)